MPRRDALALAVGAVVLVGCQSSTAMEGTSEATVVRAAPLALPAPPQRFGPLTLRAALVLASGDDSFGGLSGLWIAPDGSRLIAASDRGALWLAEPRHAPDGTLLGLAGWRSVEPGRAPGDPDTGRQDAEGLAQTGDGLVISYEGRHRLRQVALADPAAPGSALPTPAALDEPHNRGMEALVELEGGAWLALAEGVRDSAGDLLAWRIDEATTRPLTYATSDGFAPTGAARLDDTIFVVERRLSLLGGFGVRVVAFEAAAVVPGARLTPSVVGTIVSSEINENFEGIAVRRGPAGDVLLYLVSDDNFNALLRTVVLQLSLASADRLGEGVARAHQRAERQEQRQRHHQLGAEVADPPGDPG